MASSYIPGECMDGGQAGVPRTHAVAAVTLQMVEERQHVVW